MDWGVIIGGFIIGIIIFRIIVAIRKRRSGLPSYYKRLDRWRKKNARYNNSRAD